MDNGVICFWTVFLIVLSLIIDDGAIDEWNEWMKEVVEIDPASEGEYNGVVDGDI